MKEGVLNLLKKAEERNLEAEYNRDVEGCYYYEGQIESLEQVLKLIEDREE